jgi:hypothetical protein
VWLRAAARGQISLRDQVGGGRGRRGQQRGRQRRRGAAARRHIDLTHGTSISITEQAQGHGRQPAVPQDPRMQELHMEGEAGGARSARFGRRRRRRRRRRRETRSHSSHIFSCFLLLPRDQVKCERGRRAGWARSASRRVAVVGAHLRRPCSALPALPSLPIDDLDDPELTGRVPARVSQVARRRRKIPRDPAPAPTTTPRASRCAGRGRGPLLGLLAHLPPSRSSDAAELTRCRTTHASKSAIEQDASLLLAPPGDQCVSPGLR